MAPTIAEIDARIRPAVRRDLLRRGANVRRAAQDNIRGNGSAPRRVRTGDLLRSVEVWPDFTAGAGVSNEDAVQIGTRARHAGWVIRGTGLYGPHKTRIRPVRAKALRFYWDRVGDVVFFASVRGMKPNNFLVDALHAARD